MKLPVHVRESAIHDATGALVASCQNPALAVLIAERINEFAQQYARGHADATSAVNSIRDREAAAIRRQAEQRGYDRAHEELLWNEDHTYLLVA